MSRHRVAGGVTVRGECPAGHVTEAKTDPGRVTWEGDCAHDGCEHKVKARSRVTTPPQPPANDEPPGDPKTPPVKKAAASKPKVKQVDYDAQPRKRDQHDGSTGGGADDDTGAGEADPPARPRKAAAVRRQPAARADEQPGVDEPAAEPARRAGIRERITGRRAAAAQSPRPRREFRLPFE